MHFWPYDNSNNSLIDRYDPCTRANEADLPPGLKHTDSALPGWTGGASGGYSNLSDINQLLSLSICKQTSYYLVNNRTLLCKSKTYMGDYGCKVECKSFYKINTKN